MKELMENFKTISQIPHCSFQTKKLQDFLSSYAKEKGFEVSIDKAGNIHCLKNNPKICLQSHYDMVCMGTAPKIKLYEEKGFLKACNSSLGADNGIGLAIMMCAMAEFNNIECLFTNNEEVGLLGANNLEHKLQSKMLLNLDHENENEIIIGCAGGVDIEAILDFEFEESFGKIYELEAVNFKGGHSGIDIIKNPKNSIKELAKFIKQNNGKIINFNGGERINSIAKHAKALVCFENEIQESDFIKCKFKAEQNIKTCNKNKILLQVLNSFAQGTRAYDEKLSIVQSSINLSLLRMEEKRIKISLFARSNKLEELENLEFESKEFFKAFGFKVNSFNFYPPWEGEENPLSQSLFELFAKTNPKVKIAAIHAGLECGIIEKKQKLFCASIGPNIYNPHSVDERCELDSVRKIKELIYELLRQLKA